VNPFDSDLYQAPECDGFWEVTTFADAYSFAIMFAQLVTGIAWTPKAANFKKQVQEGARPSLASDNAINSQRK